MVEKEINSVGNGAVWYVHQAKTLRIRAKLSINKFAQRAGVSRESVSKVEKFGPVTELIAEQIFSALNELHDQSLNREDLVKDNPEK